LPLYFKTAISQQSYYSYNIVIGSSQTQTAIKSTLSATQHDFYHNFYIQSINYCGLSVFYNHYLNNDIYNQIDSSGVIYMQFSAQNPKQKMDQI